MADTMENILLEQMPREEGLISAEPSGGPTDGFDEVSSLGMTIAQPQTGALRPTLVIGVGAFGRRALQELRCRFLDRFGDLDKVPLIRFLYIDTDNDALKGATRGAPEVALRNSEVYHLPLQPISHYRRRQLDQLSEWLPREKLFTLPRSLKTEGSRALGRLAFADNYLRLIARLRREIQTACHPDSIYQTVSQTGLALRDNVPRIYVIACASGGGSGFLVDLGYAVRRLLNQLRQPESLLTSFLFCGAPDDPATPPIEQANLYATLTEVYHFSDPSVPFTAQYGTDGPRLVDDGTAFDNTYLLTLAHRSPEARRDAMAHLGSYLFHELTTPLGLRLERTRLSRGVLPFRSFGTYGVWFPRGLLLHLAARGACQRILEEWQTSTLDARSVIPDKHPLLPLDGLVGLGELEGAARVSAEDLLEAAQRQACGGLGVVAGRSGHSHLGNGRPPAGEQPARIADALAVRHRGTVAADGRPRRSGRMGAAGADARAGLAGRRPATAGHDNSGAPEKEPADTGAGRSGGKVGRGVGPASGFRGRRPDGASGPAHRHRRGRPQPLPPPHQGSDGSAAAAPAPTGRPVATEPEPATKRLGQLHRGDVRL